MRRNGGKVANFRINDNQLGFVLNLYFAWRTLKLSSYISFVFNKFFFVLV